MATTYVLHGDPVSGNSYKVLLTASLLSIPLDFRRYSVLRSETRTPAFLSTVSSFGRVPVLEIGSSPPAYLAESNAICHYLADTHATAAGTTPLIPADPLRKAEMLQWLFFEQNQHEVSIATLRFWLAFRGLDNLSAEQRAQIDGKRRQGAEVLDYMNAELGRSPSGWLVGAVDAATLADVVLYAYTHAADQAGFDLAKWPAIQAWLKRVAGLPGFISRETATA